MPLIRGPLHLARDAKIIVRSSHLTDKVGVGPEHLTDKQITVRGLRALSSLAALGGLAPYLEDPQKLSTPNLKFGGVSLTHLTSEPPTGQSDKPNLALYYSYSAASIKFSVEFEFGIFKF
jgi:hypothetical protein